MGKTTQGMSNKNRAILYALIASALFSFMGLFTKGFNSHGIDSYGVTEVRLLVTTACVFFLMLFFNRSEFRIQKCDILIFVGMAFSKMLMDHTYFISLGTDIDITVALALQMTMPYFVMILSYFVFKDSFTKKKVAAFAIGMAGVAIAGGFINGDFGSFEGVICALTSGFCYAVYSVGGKVFANKGYSTNNVLFYTFGLAAIMMIPFVDFSEFGAAFASSPVALTIDIVALGILCSFIPFYLLQKARELIDVSTVSIVSLSGVAFTAVVGALFLEHTPSMFSWVGIVLLVVSIFVMNADIKSIKERIHLRIKERKTVETYESSNGPESY